VKLGKASADFDTSGITKAAKRARKAGSAAAANASDAAANAAAAARNAADVGQSAAQSAADVAQSAAQTAAEVAQAAAQNAAELAQTAVGAAQNAAHNAADLAQTAGEAAQSAASTVTKEVKDKVLTARKWAAPRLETAADYTTSTAAPKVSSALRSTAKQVSVDTGSSKRKIVGWSVFGIAVLAGLGAAAAVFRNRFRAAIAADSETADEEVLSDSAGSQPAAVVVVEEPVAEEAAPTEETEAPVEPSPDGSVNGRVKTTG